MTLSIARNTVAAGAVALLVSSPAGLGAAAETKLNVVGNISITTQFKNLEKPFWTEQLAAWSDGKVTAQFQGWNEMGLKGPEVFRLLQKGVMDVGTYQLGHVSGEAPINDATDLAGLSPSLDKFLEVTHAFRPVLEQTYADRFGLKILTMQSFQAQLLYCRGELRGLADLKGKKIRTSGASQSDFVSHFGGQGVPMAFGEVQQGLQRGVIDCAITGTLGGYLAKWHEGARYLYTLPINFASGVTAANARKWDGLDYATRNMIEAHISELEVAMWQLNRQEGEIGIACNTSGPCPLGQPAGMTRVDPSPADLEQRRQAMLQTVLPRWAKRCGSDCAKAFNDTIGKVTGLSVAVQ